MEDPVQLVNSKRKLIRGTSKTCVVSTGPPGTAGQNGKDGQDGQPGVAGPPGI